jgi:hypothetical protein
MSSNSNSPQSALTSLFDDWLVFETVIPSVEALPPNWPLRKNPSMEDIRGDFTS